MGIYDFDEFKKQIVIIFFGSYFPSRCEKDLELWAKKLEKELELKKCDIVTNMPSMTNSSDESQFIYEKSMYYAKNAHVAVFFFRDQCRSSETTALELSERRNLEKKTLVVFEKHEIRKKDPSGLKGYVQEHGIQNVTTTVENDVYDLMKGQVYEILSNWFLEQLS